MKKKKQWKMQGNWQKSQNFSETCKRNSQQCGQENVNIVNAICILVSNDNSPRDAIFSSFVSMTWNIEGFSRNLHSLKYFTDQHKPSLVFLSEHSCNVMLLLF